MMPICPRAGRARASLVDLRLREALTCGFAHDTNWDKTTCARMREGCATPLTCCFAQRSRILAHDLSRSSRKSVCVYVVTHTARVTAGVVMCT